MKRNYSGSALFLDIGHHLASQTVWCHARLTGHLVGSHLQPYDVPALPQLVLAEPTLLLLGDLHPDVGSWESPGLGDGGELQEADPNLLQVLVLVQVYCLEDIQFLDSGLFNCLQKVPDVFHLFESHLRFIYFSN